MRKIHKLKTKIQKFSLKLKIIFFLLPFWSLVFGLWPLVCFPQDSSEYVRKGWALLGERKFTEVHQVADRCIAEFGLEAERLSAKLVNFPPKGEESDFGLMNDVAACYFIKGEALMRDHRTDEAKEVFREVIEKYPFAQSYDPRGWFWSIKEKSEVTLKKLETGKVTEELEEEETAVISKVKLHDPGSEFPVDYAKYGKFTGAGTENFKYTVDDPVGLAKAVGEGIYPNSSSVKFDPGYLKVKKGLSKIDHWKIFNSRDLNTAFYKWIFSPESGGVKQFFIADILERSGLIKQAVKAYYATLVNFPKAYGWTYWHTPWYIGESALYRLKYLLRKNPALGLKLKGASFKVVNGYDNDIRNDRFIVNPGKLAALTFWENLFRRGSFFKERRRKLAKVVETKGKGRVKLLKYENGDWRLSLDDQPFMIKGITYAPTRVGESPDEGTLENWAFQDLNKNGLADGPYDAWVDKNGNNQQDEGERPIGDFQLLKDMGVNTLRVYYQPFKLNKALFRKMYAQYGIYVALGNFLGKYALGSGASWEEGTDYDNPLHKKKMLESVKEMVLEFRDEPYILIWLLGNENVYGLGCNADKKPESFFKFVNEAALLIKSLDPQRRPVAIVSGDVLYLDLFAKYCPDLDIFGTNAYRGKYGFFNLWNAVREVAGKPALISEYGAPSYAKGYTLKEADDFQADYHRNAWQDIFYNSAGYGAGSALGGFAFEWLDEWWKAYEPSHHDKKGLFSGPFLDGYMHEEWLGLCSQGDGKNSPYLRQLKKAYFVYKELWRDG